MSTSAGRPATIGRGHRPQTLLHISHLKESADKYNMDSASFDDYKDANGYEDAKILEEMYHLKLRAIMDRIQALASTVASLQLTSDRQKLGRQIRREQPSHKHEPTGGQVLGEAPCMWPPPEHLDRHIQQATPQDTLTDLGYLGHEDLCLSASPALLSLQEDRQGTLPRLRLERLIILPLAEWHLLLICLLTAELHIRVLWGIHYVIHPSHIPPWRTGRSSYLLETSTLVFSPRPRRSRQIG